MSHFNPNRNFGIPTSDPTFFRDATNFTIGSTSVTNVSSHYIEHHTTTHSAGYVSPPAHYPGSGHAHTVVSHTYGWTEVDSPAFAYPGSVQDLHHLGSWRPVETTAHVRSSTDIPSTARSGHDQIAGKESIGKRLRRLARLKALEKGPRLVGPKNDLGSRGAGRQGGLGTFLDGSSWDTVITANCGQVVAVPAWHNGITIRHEIHVGEVNSTGIPTNVLDASAPASASHSKLPVFKVGELKQTFGSASNAPMLDATPQEDSSDSEGEEDVSELSRN